MNRKKYILVSLFMFSIVIMKGQNLQFSTSGKAIGGEYKFNENNIRCISAAQRADIDSVTHEMSSRFRAENLPVRQAGGQQKMVTLFDWPLQKSSTAPYSGVWAISNFVDHNPVVTSQITDYNCGTRSYDTSDGYNHQGVDIFLWPFSWDMMDKNYAEVVAAAPGTIFFKQDGNSDQSCAMGGGDWNAIYIVHADGSYALYGHMKKNSLTTKGVGDAVVAGEFLGVVGSSGNSTGPHLHFEVFDSNDNLIDPFAGPCNALNAASWWSNQMDYREPNINAVMTHSAPPDFNPCPQIETIHADDAFNFGENFYTAIYLKDQLAGTTVTYTLKRDNGSVITTWNQTFQNTYSSAYWYYTFVLDDPGSGGVLDMVFEVSYQGQVKSHAFQVGDLGTEENITDEITVYPNPFSEKITVSGSDALSVISIYDISGKLIQKKISAGTYHELNTVSLSKGIYFLRLVGENGKEIVRKLIKE